MVHLSLPHPFPDELMYSVITRYFYLCTTKERTRQKRSASAANKLIETLWAADRAGTDPWILFGPPD